jgi:hypothetical protein
LNLYAYCGDNPVTGLDPNGTDGYNPQKVNALIRKIINVHNKIQQRLGELREDPQNLPEHAGPNAKPSEDRAGHRRLINEDKALLDKLQAELEQEVQKGDDPTELTPFQRQLAHTSNGQYAAGAVAVAGAAVVIMVAPEVVPAVVRSVGARAAAPAATAAAASAAAKLVPVH